MWSFLRARRLGGLRFRRQHSIGPFVVDFYCAEAALVVELDGETHTLPGRQERDARRQDDLERRGLRVVRFGNEEVYARLQAVLEAVFEAATGRKLVWGPEGPEDPESFMP